MSFLDSLRDSWERLNERERRLLLAMSGVAALMLLFVSMWLSSAALAEVEEERDAITEVLEQIERSSAELVVREQQRQKTEKLYEREMPPLAAFLETKAKGAGLEVRQVVEQPEKEVEGYRRQQVRLSFSAVSLRSLVHFLTAVAEESLPLAFDRLNIEHYQSGDKYNCQVGVVAFDASNKKKSAKEDRP